MADPISISVALVSLQKLANSEQGKWIKKKISNHIASKILNLTEKELTRFFSIRSGIDKRFDKLEKLISKQNLSALEYALDEYRYALKEDNNQDKLKRIENADKKLREIAGNFEGKRRAEIELNIGFCNLLLDKKYIAVERFEYARDFASTYMIKTFNLHADEFRDKYYKKREFRNEERDYDFDEAYEIRDTAGSYFRILFDFRR